MIQALSNPLKTVDERLPPATKNKKPDLETAIKRPRLVNEKTCSRIKKELKDRCQKQLTKNYY